MQQHFVKAIFALVVMGLLVLFRGEIRKAVDSGDHGREHRETTYYPTE